MSINNKPLSSSTPNNLDSEEENSDCNLQIVLDSPRTPKRRKNKAELDDSDIKIIACVEKDLEETLEQKAAKANLTATHVKNILKHVVTNEHVLALVRHAENPDEEPVTVYEPKCTRAKAKQMLFNQIKPNVVSWSPPPNLLPETQMLFSENLDEDSEDDEYLPEKKVIGVELENTPSSKEKNIALRTRSKLSLSHTPLEALEESFMPPDITTDMYDIDCDDDVWRDFLKTFTKPLDEVAKATEDEDHDPEYNILADEEIDEVDVEELRADRAVTVSRKEFNNLMTELFEYADIYEANNQNNEQQTQNNSIESLQTVQTTIVIEPVEENVEIRKTQVPLLIQQLHQHVQMLTQNFILSYEHPEFGGMAAKFKQCLVELQSLGENKDVTIIKSVVNLEPALKLVNYWQKIFDNNEEIAQEAKTYVQKIIVESLEAKYAGTEYVVTFPSLVMDTILNSEVFLYPKLLPRIPFRSSNITNKSYTFFNNSENNLLAIYLEQLSKSDNGTVKKMDMYRKIQEHVMPHVCLQRLKNHVIRKKNANAEENPIKYYYREHKAPPTVHYVAPLQIQAPIKADPESLPHQWKNYVLKQSQIKQEENVQKTPPVVISTPVTVYSPCKEYKVVTNFAKPEVPSRKILPKGPVPILPSGPRRRRRRLYTKKGPTYNDLVQEALRDEITVVEQVVSDDMFRDMPSLGNTPMKNDREPEEPTPAEQPLTFKNVTSCGHQYYKPQTETKRDFSNISEFSSEKDNPDDINELMRASSTVKHIPKKTPSGAEKKRAKLRREFVSNLTMATPEDKDSEKQRQNDFAGAYFDKLSQTLAETEWQTLLNVFNNYDHKTCEFVDFYAKVQAVLEPKYRELSDEFLLFLTEIQAYKIGKLMPYFRMQNMQLFLKKVQIYFKEQPTQMKKIMKCLTDLCENGENNAEAVKSQMLPLLKGNSALSDLFQQLFEHERPPSLLSTGPSEIVDITKELSRPPDEDIYETVVVPDCEDPYGGLGCICTCHNKEDPRVMHCSKCSLKFIGGKVYMQKGKSLRPAVVSFLTNPEKDHTERLSATQRKLDTSPNKAAISPPKEEVRHSNESEEDCDGNKKKRLQKPERKRKHREKDDTTKDNDKAKTKPVKTTKKTRTKKVTNKKEAATKMEPITGQKRPAESSVEIEFSEPPEFVELKVSSDHSGESESEYLESSQDVTYTDSDESSTSSITSQKEQICWSRDEDKIILQAFKQGKSNEDTFKQIKTVLPNRTVHQIKNRFYKLMSLLQEMAKVK